MCRTGDVNGKDALVTKRVMKRQKKQIGTNEEC